MHESDTEDSPRSHKKNALTEHIAMPPKGAAKNLLLQLNTVAKKGDRRDRRIPGQSIVEATQWMQALQANMEAMASLTPEQKDHIADLDLAAKGATKEYAAKTGKVIKTNWAAASLMYWLSFGPGKIVTNAASGVLTALQLPVAASFTPWINSLGVPIIQVLFAEPMGGARRNDGQSYQSPDGVAYSNYQTAHALLIRAWIEGNRDDAKAYKKIMGDITAKLIEREQKRHADGTRRIPERLTSGATDANAVSFPTPVDWARVRSFLSDEVPVHTFSLLNGITGGVSLLWPKLMSTAWARAPDAGVHVLMGTFAMAWMFDWQNRWRKDFQGASVAHGADSEILALKKAAPEERLRIWTAKKNELQATLEEVEAMDVALDSLLRKTPNIKEQSERREQAEACLTQVRDVKREIQLKLKDIRRAKARAERQKHNWESGGARVCAAFTSTMSSYMGETDKQPVKWLDGSPIVVRNISKLFGYMAALSPTAVQGMMLAQRLMAPALLAHNATTGMNSTVPQPMAWGNATASTGHDNPWEDYVMASTVAFTAILGWNLRNLACVPTFEHLIHGTIGVAHRIVDVGSGLCGLTPPARHEPSRFVNVQAIIHGPLKEKNPSSSSSNGDPKATKISKNASSSSSEAPLDVPADVLEDIPMFPESSSSESPREEPQQKK